MREKSATFGDDVSITEAIIETVCELKGIDREEFDYVLYDWVDPDALAKLFADPPGNRRSITVDFLISEFQITICNDSAQGGRMVTARDSAPEVTSTGLEEESAQKI